MISISRAGETMWLVQLEPRIDEHVNRHAVDLAARLGRLSVRGVRDIVPAYCTVGVHFDPLVTDLAMLESTIATEAEASTATALSEGAAPVVEIPTRYGGAHGPDIESLASWAGCSPDEVIERHSMREYRVYMLGFVPGFAYLGKVDSRIAAPRHRTPRERVPAGSVGIAGEQTGVYPIVTPGGWQIIGRTDVRMFDASRTPPTLLSPGARVRFVPIRDLHS